MRSFAHVSRSVGSFPLASWSPPKGDNPRSTASSQSTTSSNLRRGSHRGRGGAVHSAEKAARKIGGVGRSTPSPVGPALGQYGHAGPAA